MSVQRQEVGIIFSFAPVPSALLQRNCACGNRTKVGSECEGCSKKRRALQRAFIPCRGRGIVGEGEAPPIVQQVLRSRGQPLDPATRAFFEPRFGRDFSGVRVHTDTKAAESARDINALAYTVGKDVVFGAEQYAPGTKEGKRLLAHELTHTLQQAPIIARQEGAIPAPPLETGGPALERARTYQPRFRPHEPRAPTISPPPPVPEEATPPRGPCPSAADVVRELRNNNVASQTETEMQRNINLAQARAARGKMPVTPTRIQQADRAIRAEFGDALPSGRDFTAQQSVTVRSPAEFAQVIVPDNVTARRRIASAALEVSGDLLRSLCITNTNNAQVQSEVATPILQRRGIDFVRDHQASRIGGQTTFPDSGGQMTPHVDLPRESRNVGHIIVHEAMHFYVSDVYRRTAEASFLRQQMMEGGAEFLARHVINQRLSSLPEFQINSGTYSSEFSYVSSYLMRGGLSTFKLAYFQGRVDILGLSPLQPKRVVSESGDEFEREADRVAEAITSKDEIPPIVHEVLLSSGQPLDPNTCTFFEPRFGHDFSQVQVHPDPKAAESARAVNALAYTVGKDILSETGQFAPEAAGGRKLLSRNFVHAVQQGTKMAVPSEDSSFGPAHAKTQYEAKLAARQVVRWSDVRTMQCGSYRPLLQRQTPSTGRGGGPKKLVLDLPKQQLKAIGNPAINAIVDALPPRLLNRQSAVIKRVNVDNIEHIFELAITIQPGSPSITATNSAEVTEKPSAKSGQTIKHPIALEIFQSISDPVMTLYHELIHVQLIIDRSLPADQQSETYGKFAQRLEMASDPALLTVTGTTPKREAVFDRFRRLRAWYQTFVSGFQVWPALDGPADEERYRTLINEYFANKEAQRAFKKPESNASLAKRYAQGVRAQFQIAAQGQGLVSILSQARERAQNSSGGDSDFDVADQLGTALAALFDALDQQLQQIEEFKQSPPKKVPSGASNPYPRPVDINRNEVP